MKGMVSFSPPSFPPRGRRADPGQQMKNPVHEPSLDAASLKRENTALRRQVQTLERRLAEREASLRAKTDALRETQSQLEGQFRSLAESASEIICRYDRACRLVFANSALSVLLRRPLNDLLGKTPKEHDPGLRLTPYQSLIEAVIESGTERDTELILPDTGDGIRYHHIRIFPERGRQGETIGALALGRDITDRKQAEDRLYASEQAFRAVVEHAPDYIARYDVNCRRLYVNPALRSLLQHEREHVIGTTPAELSRFIDPHHYMNLLRTVVRTGKVVTEEVRLRYEDGRIGWGHILAAPEFSVSGAVVSVLAISRDISESKEAEQRLLESYDILRELTSRRETAREEERKRIARELHDELGQQLTALRMGASTLRLRFGPGNPELTEHVQKLLQLADQTMHVVRQAVSSLRPAALDAGIAAGLEWLVAEFTRGAKAEYRLSLPDENLPLDEAHAIAVFRIAQEALTNIARHARARRVFVSLGIVRSECLLEVSDDGCGFDPVASRKRSFGLAGMKERVLMLGGKIAIDSAPGKGTKIEVKLPMPCAGAGDATQAPGKG